MGAESAPPRLSPRLRAIAALIPRDAAMADIGTDHGLLPIALLSEGAVRRAIAVDLRAAPLAVAAANRDRVPAAASLELRLGDGLGALAPGEAQVAIMAGLGRRTIERLIGTVDTDTLGIQRLVLQPERDPWRLRAWLAGAGWRIEDEIGVQDGSRLYTVMRVVRDPQGQWWDRWSLADRLLGQAIRRRGGPVLAALVAHHRSWLTAEVKALSAHAGDGPRLAERKAWLAALDATD